MPHVSKLRHFWDEMEDHPLLVGHPVRARRNWKSLCVPISIHGDGVPCVGVGKSWTKSMELLSWASCVASGTTMNTFHYIFGVFAHLLSTRFGMNTMQQFWKILAWSLRALFAGEWRVCVFNVHMLYANNSHVQLTIKTCSALFHRFPSHKTIHSTHITKQKRLKGQRKMRTAACGQEALLRR